MKLNGVFRYELSNLITGSAGSNQKIEIKKFTGSKLSPPETQKPFLFTTCTHVVRSQRRRVPSQEPERANCPSEEMTTSLTK